MAYIGVDPNVGDITFQTFTGDGSATAFTLAQNVVSEATSSSSSVTSCKSRVCRRHTPRRAIR